MNMTHYMALLADNQPWNLILFMAIPVILAETVAITELFILFSRPQGGWLRRINRWASITGGIYFTGVFIYLTKTAVIPLTASGGWLGAADVIAVGCYLAGIIPLGGMALLDLGLIGKAWDEERKLKLHAIFVAIFLVIAHIAMIFGMLDPTLLMSDAASAGMSGMHH
ncbi:DUF6803 family protein [Chitinibacter tainanensis]|uniref:DUF6803 family protein n=1 Tax=Chitinibacter tainanensis TaxID=230667 RepID=UPI002357DE64|nr:DUF6803 family protein [Chitinibacter tainanensis]